MLSMIRLLWRLYSTVWRLDWGGQIDYVALKLVGIGGG